MTRPLSVLVMSTPVGAVGSGTGGGVEITLRSLVSGLVARGHRVEVVAPVGSVALGVPVEQVEGALQPSMQFVDRSSIVDASAGSVLDNMWHVVRRRHVDFDLVLNLAYDELPFLTSGELSRPVAHLVSMGSLTDAMDTAVRDASRSRPGSVAVHSRAQADTFPLDDSVVIVGGGIDIDSCPFVPNAHTDGRLAFVGRISAEKGLRDVVAASALAKRPLHVWGLLQDDDGLIAASKGVVDAHVTYRGFVAPEQLRSEIGECAALVMAPKWVEAFGIVAVEALACGVPVVAYRRGGPAEIIDDGRTGLLVPPDDVAGLAAAIGRVERLSRQECRDSMAVRFSVGAFAERVEAWLAAVVGAYGSADFRRTPLSF